MKKIHKILIVCLILIIFLFIFNYKKFFLGNTINIKIKEKNIENILNGKLNYKSDIVVTVFSNKTKNVYSIMQEENNGKSYQEIKNECDIKGLKILYTEDALKVENSKLKLEKIYQDFEPIMNDYLFLSSFSNDYLKNEDKSIEEEDGEIIIKVKIENSNKYIKYKELYVNKETGKPIKMVIKDSDKQVVVCIEYINLEVI